MANFDNNLLTSIEDETPGMPRHAFAITPNDADTYGPSIHVYVGVSGDVSIIPASGGAAVTFAGVPAGFVLPCRAQRVRATGTTATSLVGIV